ncbi:MAG: ferredoxin [Deltaproteobacteria bacterium]
MLSPLEPGFWPHLTAQPEWRDGQPNPVDRWSRRVITEIAERYHGTPVFPFGDPPWQPFLTWAIASGAFHASPVQLLVHQTMGLWSSFRGAIILRDEIATSPTPNPCETCLTKPCLTACPVAAMTENGYDTKACHTYLDTAPGKICLNSGCRVRNACPLSQSYGRVESQSAHHMRQFHI